MNKSFVIQAKTIQELKEKIDAIIKEISEVLK